jgi:hypothetical protein
MKGFSGADEPKDEPFNIAEWVYNFGSHASIDMILRNDAPLVNDCLLMV